MLAPASLPIADPKKRISAFIIDDIVISLLFMAIFYDQISVLFGDVAVIDQTALETLNHFITENFLILVMIKVLYHGVLVWQNGMTLGKYIMKIKVIDLDTGNVPNVSKAFLRAALRIPSEVFFYLGFLMAFFVPYMQTLHDKLSKCVVIDA
jgi:uncharacterized RDD family membrane protein YckC